MLSALLLELKKFVQNHHKQLNFNTMKSDKATQLIQDNLYMVYHLRNLSADPIIRDWNLYASPLDSLVSKYKNLYYSMFIYLEKKGYSEK